MIGVSRCKCHQWWRMNNFINHKKVPHILLAFILCCQISLSAGINTIDDESRKSSIKGDGNELASGMVEIVLSTLETKLRSVENLDRAVQHLTRKMDGIEATLNLNANSILNRLQIAADTETQRYDAIQAKMAHLVAKFDSVCEEDVEAILEGDPVFALPSVRRSAKVLPFSGAGGASTTAGRRLLKEERFFLPHQTDDRLKEVVDEVQTAVSGMDRRLAFHINIVSENMGKMTNMVKEVHDAVFEEEEEDEEAKTRANRSFFKRRGGSPVAFNNRTEVKKRSKLDRLVKDLKPIAGTIFNVRDRVNQVQNTLDGNKYSIENDLVSRTDDLLNRNRRFEHMLLQVQNNLNEKAKAIVQGLLEVGKELADTKESIATSDSNREPSRPRALVFNPLLTQQDSFDNELDAAGSVNHVSTVEASERSDVFENGDDDADIRTNSIAGRPSVIFPSIENKPLPINSTFTTFDAAGKQIVQQVTGFSCSDLYDKNVRDSGIYYLQIGGTRYWYLRAYCEMSMAGGGWTVIQRRDDYGKPRQNFNRGWEEYKYGFGDQGKEFWLGNENIYMLTQSDDYELRIELEDFDGNKRYAEYSNFRLGSEKELYRLEVGGFGGDAGDTFNDPWYGSNLRPFSTFDKDNDRSSLNCASMLKGGWWWKSCGRGLNGLYLTDPKDTTARQGIVWFRWRGWDYSLKRSQMMIRPRKWIPRSSKSRS